MEVKKFANYNRNFTKFFRDLLFEVKKQISPEAFLLKPSVRVLVEIKPGFSVEGDSGFKLLSFTTIVLLEKVTLVFLRIRVKNEFLAPLLFAYVIVMLILARKIHVIF